MYDDELKISDVPEQKNYFSQAILQVECVNCGPSRGIPIQTSGAHKHASRVGVSEFADFSSLDGHCQGVDKL